MLYEFAITPDFFRKEVVESNRITVTEILKGLCDNGLIANFNKDRWEKYIANELIPQLEPKIRDKVMNLLNILKDRKRLVRYPRIQNSEPQTDLEWFDHIIEYHSKIPFYGIVFSHLLSDSIEKKSEEFIELEGALDSPKWLNRKKTIMIERSEEGFRDLLAGVLRHAKHVSLIDPYMTYKENRFSRVIEMVSELAGNRSFAKQPVEIEIHTGNPEKYGDYMEPVDDCLKAWKNFLSPLSAKYSHKFKVVCWGEKNNSKPHNRYIITNQCGLSIPSGLDIRKSSKTEICLLDEEDKCAINNNYNDKTSCYELLAETKIGY
jgi:hypothetical protein